MVREIPRIGFPVLGQIGRPIGSQDLKMAFLEAAEHSGPDEDLIEEVPVITHISRIKCTVMA